MEIILTENVEGLGSIGDQVKVKPGYARNFLVPRGFAVEANKRNVKELEHHRRQMEYKRKRVTQDAEAVKARIEKITCEFALRASEEGKLFGSVTAIDIAETLAQKGVDLDRKKIQLDEPIKTLGQHDVPAKLPAGVTATIKVVVNSAE